MTKEEILKKTSEIHVILEKNNGKSIKLFGSTVTNNSNNESDVDFLVRLNKGASLFDLIGIQLELEDLLGSKVDVISEGGLKDNKIGRNIRRSAILI